MTHPERRTGHKGNACRRPLIPPLDPRVCCIWATVSRFSGKHNGSSDSAALIFSVRPAQQRKSRQKIKECGTGSFFIPWLVIRGKRGRNKRSNSHQAGHSARPFCLVITALTSCSSAGSVCFFIPRAFPGRLRRRRFFSMPLHIPSLTPA